KTRVIPCLLLNDESLVKTVNFKNLNYIGDPVNAVRIFNELEVDELILLDIKASQVNAKPNFSLISDIASECFMPLSYGGGIKTVTDIKRLYKIGVEKVAINTAIIDNPNLIKEAAELFGSQAVIASIDVKKTIRGNHNYYYKSAKIRVKADSVDHAINCEKLGAGELLINSIDRDGTWSGYDIEILKKITSKVGIPVIAVGGAGKVQDFYDAVINGGVSAVAAASMFVYQSKGLGVLINFPDKRKLKELP
ncbi:MAG: AglZ/HisF2 family acetamidino modification protein, partial [Candidatus Hodarchaeales archaeon]